MKKIHLFLLISLGLVVIGASCSLYPASPSPANNAPAAPSQEQATPAITPEATPPAAPTQPATIPPPTASAKADVSISNFSFNPASVTINAGMTVVWTNNDSAPHTIALNDGSLTSAVMANGQLFSQTFTAAGIYAYHCSIHPSMQGTVIVK